MRTPALVIFALGCAAPARTAAPAHPGDGDGVIARWTRGESATTPATGCGECAPVHDPLEALDPPESNDPLDPLDSEALGYATLGQAMPDEDAAYQPPPAPADEYAVIEVPDPGAVEGVDTWREPPHAPAQLAGGEGCPRLDDNPTLKRGPAGVVAGTLVFLEDIHAGKAPAVLGGVVEDVGCELVPHAQVASPIGALILVANDDGLARDFAIHAAGGSHVPFFDEVLAPHRQTEVPLGIAGTYEVVVAGSAVPGLLVVPRHPYYAFTDEHGHYRLDDVPPGEYTVTAWHEPVAMTAGRAPSAGAHAHVRVESGVVAARNLELR